MKVHIGPYKKYNKRTKKTPPRNIKIKIDKYDVWNLDHTLAMIILPALKLLKKQKQGAPLVDDSDVPDELKSINAEDNGDLENGHIDSNWHKRWDWIMDEMIWSFKQLTIDWENQFHSGKIDIKWVEIPNTEFVESEKGPKHTHKFDIEGYRKHSKRIDNGLILFGKYYRGLWD